MSVSQFSHSVMSHSLQSHGLQHSRLPCPSPTPGAYSNSRPLGRWYHPTISSSVVPFSSQLQYFQNIPIFLNPPWTSGSSWLMYYWNLAWRILSISLLVCEMRAIVPWFEHSLALPFFGIGVNTDLFQSCGHCWVFQICWSIEWSTLTTLSFRIWNTSSGIPSPPLALFIVMLPKAYLTSYSRLSGSRWGRIPSWLSGPWRSFFV